MTVWISRLSAVAALVVTMIQPAWARPTTMPAAPHSWPALQPWVSDPDWVDHPTAIAPQREVDQPRPEPIPLPAAGIIGPAVLTALLAAASLKKRRPRARVMR